MVVGGRQGRQEGGARGAIALGPGDGEESHRLSLLAI